MIPMDKWKWKGLPGHWLCTIVGKYMISTVGAMYVGEGPLRELREIGLKRHYETFVFELNRKGIAKDFGSPVDADGLFLGEKATTSDEVWDKRAERMHLKMCKKYARKQ